MKRNSSGFTLAEVSVTVLILGILALVAVPQYLKSVEVSRAHDAVTGARLIAEAQRMYFVDYKQHVGPGAVTNACNDPAGGCGALAVGNTCRLSACGYLAKQDWDSKEWSFFAVPSAPATDSPCGGGLLFPSGNYVSCAMRQAGGPSMSAGWGYAVRVDGVVVIASASTTPTN